MNWTIKVDVADIEDDEDFAVEGEIDDHVMEVTTELHERLNALLDKTVTLQVVDPHGNETRLDSTPGGPFPVLVQPDMLTSVKAAVRAANAAASGSCNDVEIELLRDALELACTALGIIAHDQGGT